MVPATVLQKTQMDDQSYWNVERWRLVLVLFIAFLGGMLSKFWLLSFTLTFAGYIVWLLYKLNELKRWLDNGAKARQIPDSNGCWERITILIQAMQKKSNARKKRMVKLLKRSQEIISGLPYAAVVLDKGNKIDWANNASQEYLNIDSLRDRGHRIDNLLRIPELHGLLRQNSKEEIVVTLPHNKEKKLALKLIPLKLKQKLLIAEDVSERVHIHEMRKNFIANASHELRTPLTVISGYLEMMQADDNLPEHLQTSVGSAADQSSRMRRIIEDLLALSRLENSELDNNAGSVIDVPALIQSICTDEASMMLNDTHTLETDIEKGLKLRGVEAEIISLFGNLIHNAIRHTHEGTHVKVLWKRLDEDAACFIVQDNGQGIPSEHIKHLTERFYRVDKGRSRDKGGTGLGLSIVQHIVQRHQGKLDIQSQVGRGSTFTVFFPKYRILG